MRVEHDAETHQIVLWAMGEAHADVLLDRLENRHGVAVDQVELKVPLRETFAGTARGHGRHVKQSGGHGQYAVCDIEVEPLPTGAGFEFVDKVVGGAVPRQFVPSVEKGLRAQLARGLVAGCPGGGRPGHPARRQGAQRGLLRHGLPDRRRPGPEGRRRGHPDVLLEPVDEVVVHVPDDLVGTVMSDLSGRRGRVTGSEPCGDDLTEVRAEVPAAEIGRYAVDLRAFSHGTASFTRGFVRYEPMPEPVAERVLETVRK